MRIEGRRWHVHIEWHGRDYGDEVSVGVPALGALVFGAIAVGLLVHPGAGALVLAGGFGAWAVVDLLLPVKRPERPDGEPVDEDRTVHTSRLGSSES